MWVLVLAGGAYAIDPAELAYADRVHLQQALIDGGWLKGKADGNIGPMTMRALERQQNSAGRSFDGNLYGNALESLIAGRERDPRFEVINNYDLPYNDYRSGLDDPALSNLDLIECQQLCSGDDACMAYTYNVSARVCFLKTSGDAPVAFEAAVSGRRLTLGMQSVATPIAPKVASSIDPPALTAADYAGDAPSLCTVLPTAFVARRSAIRPWQAGALAFLEADRKTDDASRVSQAKELLTPYLAALDKERRRASAADLGMLVYDAARLVAAAQIPWQEISSETVMQEAEEFLSGPLDDVQAVELALQLTISRGSNYDVQFIPRLSYLVRRHEELAGLDIRQWAAFSAMGGNFEITNFSPEIVAAQTQGLRERVEWAKRFGDRRVLVNAVGTWLEKAALTTSGGRRPEAGQLLPLLDTARSLLPTVEAWATADLDVVLPSLAMSSVDQPCVQVLATAVGGVMRVLMAEGSQDERSRVLAFGVLRTLNTGMFGTEPTGTVDMANDLLKLRLMRPDLYEKAAPYVTTDLQCFPGEPALACMEEGFAGTYQSINRGTLALDFQRAAYDATLKAATAPEVVSRAAFHLALLEEDIGSVARAEDLVAGLPDQLWQDLPKWGFGDHYAAAALQFERAVRSGDDARIEELLVRTIDDRLAEDAAIPVGSFRTMEAPPADGLVAQYAFDGVCANCPRAKEAVRRWLLTKISQGNPSALLDLRLSTRDLFSETEKERAAGQYLRALTSETNGKITNGSLEIVVDLPRRVLALRSRPMTDLQLATVIALAQSHPHPAEGMDLWIVDFARFMFESNATKKQQLYDRMLTDHYSLLDEFGTDSWYLSGLSSLSRSTLLAGYPLAGQIIDRHILAMFDEKLGYLGENPILIKAARVENAMDIVPAYARLAQAAAEAGHVDEAIRYVDLATNSAVEALEANWRTGDERAVLKYRQLEPALRLAAQVLVRADADDDHGGLDDRVFAALQLAMMGDTAISAQAAQRRRALVDTDARQALIDRDTAEDSLLILDYYRSEIGIVDAQWEAEEVARRTAALEQSTSRFEQYFPRAEVIQIAPVALTEAQSLLGDDEALLVLHSGTDAIYAMLAERNGAPLTWTVPISSAELFDRISVIRSALEIPASGQLSADFPFAEAHQLLVDLLGPAAQRVEGKPRLLIVVDGSLQLLPLSILPTRIPSVLPKTVDDFRNPEIGWLGAEKSLLYLPTISSLRARASDIRPARHAFAGIGNPQLVRARTLKTKDEDEDEDEVTRAAVYGQDGLADPSFLNSLTPLPETQVEVFALAQINGAEPTDVLVGATATETNLKAKSLGDYRLVLFATHGLVSGEALGPDEPGLVLTPPVSPTATDDGYLGLSEIIKLDINAELVILSACNTAASDGRQSSAGLSGLARGFLTAGAQSVAVTHWSIPSAATLSLNVAWMRAKAANPSADWADALRQGVDDMVKREGPPSFAHPANWGAFEIFGAPPVRSN